MQTFKFSGAGNTFVIAEDFDEKFSPSEVPSLCQIHEVDGLILARSSERADFEMVYFNRDGSLASMCGNGLRCFVHFLRDQGITLPLYKIEIAGEILTVKSSGETILTFHPIPKVLDWEIELNKRKVYVVDSGVPHVVVLETVADVNEEGRALRFHRHLEPSGANINFVKLDQGRLFVRTYERGVEAETLACGTGVIASAFVANKLGYVSDEVEVVARSGDTLTVKIGSEIELVGPSVKVS